MSGEMVVGWRCHDVAANSHEHKLSPPVCLQQLSFVELVVLCWRGLEATLIDMNSPSEQIMETN